MKREKGESDKVVVSTRASVRDLATIVAYLEVEGALPRTKSQLLARALSLLADLIISKEPRHAFTSLEEALSFLDRRGLGIEVDMRNKNTRPLGNNLLSELEVRNTLEADVRNILKRWEGPPPQDGE